MPPLAPILRRTYSFLSVSGRLCFLLVCCLLHVDRGCSQAIKSSTYCSGVSSTFKLGNRRYWEQPVVVVPFGNGDSLYVNGSYLLNQNGSSQISAIRNNSFTIAGNATVVLGTYVRGSCLTFSIAGSDSEVYAFVTNWLQTDGHASPVAIDFTYPSAAGISMGSISSDSLPVNASAARQLEFDSKNFTADFDVQPLDTFLFDNFSIVIVNPSPEPKSASLNVAFNSLGPCRLCNERQNANGFLGNCTKDFDEAVVRFDAMHPDPVPASELDILLVPSVELMAIVAEGEAGVFSVFTNASCLLYTLLVSDPPADFDINKAELNIWVSSSGDQNAIISSGNISSLQKQNLRCNYPTTIDPQQPCHVYTDALKPSETYFVWVENVQGGSAVGNGSLLVSLEVIALGDAEECNFGALSNISVHARYFQSVIAEGPSSGQLSSPPLNTNFGKPYPQSPYDPGVVPPSFFGIPVSRLNAISKVGSDGSLSQVGTWDVPAPVQNGSTVTYGKPEVLLSSRQNFSLNIGDFSSVSYASGATFSNAACINVSMIANSSVNTFVFTKADVRAHYNASSAQFDNGLFALSVAGSYRTPGANYLASLSPNETYIFLVNGATQNNTQVSVATVKFPPGASVCSQSRPSGSPSPSHLPPPAAPSPGGTIAAVSGVYDNPVFQNNAVGAADSTGAVTGAACIAFALSARGGQDNMNITSPITNFSISAPSTASSPDLNASAILLDSAANDNFATTGFIILDDYNSTVKVLAGCSVNASSPGPCYTFADMLDPQQIYFLWVVIGSKSSSTWFLATYEALPKGSCRNLMTGPWSGGGAPPPSSNHTVASSPSSNSTPVGAIAGGAVGGAVALAAVVCVFVFAHRRWSRKKQASPPLSRLSNLFLNNQDDGIATYGTENCIQYNTLVSMKSFHFGSQLPPTFFQMPEGLSETSGVSRQSTPDKDPAGGPPLSSKKLHSESIHSANTGSQALDDFARLQKQREIDLSTLKIKTCKEGLPIKLGQGGFGVVMLGMLDDQDVAVKESTGKSPSQKQAFLRELSILKGCRDPAIVQILGASVSEERTVLLMEYMPGGDLYRRLQGPQSQHFLWYNRGSKIAMDVAKGLHYLHSRGILHLDLKTPNILLTKLLDAKISDVGLAKVASDTGTKVRGSSLMWASPEQLARAPCTAASDMFSFGIILWELCTGDTPTKRRLFRELKVPKEAPRKVADLITKCLMPRPGDRPTVQQAYEVLKLCAHIPHTPTF